MKKRISLLLAALLIAACTGCGKTSSEMLAPEPTAAPTEDPALSELPEEVREQIDKAKGEPVETGGMQGGEEQPLIAVSGAYFEKKDRNVLQLWSEIYGEEAPFVFTIAPAEGEPEFDAWSKSMKVEIMAGKGPDAFVLMTASPGNTANTASEAVTVRASAYPFPDVERAMRQKLFLPLDDLIAGSAYYRPEDHVQAVMDAGKLDGKQLVLPLAYKIPGFLVDAEQVSEEEIEAVETLDDLLHAENPYLAYHAHEGIFLWFCDLLPDVVDYENDDVLLEEDELAADLKRMHDLAMDGVPDFTPDDDAQARLNWETVYFLDDTLLQTKNGLLQKFAMIGLPGASGEHETRFVPVPDENGVLPARITAFCAINANTEHAETCWKLLELLYSEEAQSGWTSGGGAEYLLEVAAPVGGQFAADGGTVTGKKSQMYADYGWALDRIGRVRFTGYLDDAYAAYGADMVNLADRPEEDYRKAAENMLRELRLDLAE